MLFHGPATLPTKDAGIISRIDQVVKFLPHAARPPLVDNAARERRFRAATAPIATPLRRRNLHKVQAWR
jgi:hypothetical protein